jgi:hypothetical protein
MFYLVVYALACLPGLLIGRALFGATAAAWIGGALLGYAITQFALWACIAAGLAGALWFVAAWIIATAAAYAVFRGTGAPLIAFDPWTRRDAAALCFVLLLVPILMGLPYANIGRQDANGTRYYRAYFTADFVWHTALASELGKYDMPPRNPYMAAERLHYYWTYFLLPSVVAESGPAPLRDVQLALKANALCNALLLASAIFLFTRTAVPNAAASACAVALVLTAASAEGAMVLWEIASGPRTLDYVRTVNIDAITAWRFDGLRIDGLPRSMLYNPQHSLSLSLAVTALATAFAAGFRATPRQVLAAGTLLGLSTTMNPFLGGMFGVIYGAGMALEGVRRRTREDLLQVGVHALAALPVVAAILWCNANEMTEGAGSAVTFGFGGDARNSPVATVMVSLGPVLVPAIIGLFPLRGVPVLPALVAGAGVVIALLLMHLVRISDGAWVGFRSGQIIQCVLPVLVARACWLLAGRSRALAAAVVVLSAAAGLPTTAIDIYNAQDIANLRMGPGFPWTLTVTPAQQEAFAWIRERTPPSAVVQMDAIARGRAHWSLIPTFAERRMAAGLPISLLATPEYRTRSETVRQIYTTANAREARDLARRLRIDYIYVDGTEGAAHGDALAKFDRAPEFFTRVFANPEVRLYAVR